MHLVRRYKRAWISFLTLTLSESSLRSSFNLTFLNLEAFVISPPPFPPSMHFLKFLEFLLATFLASSFVVESRPVTSEANRERGWD